MEAIEVYLHTVGRVISLIVEAIALFLVAAGTVEALTNIVRIVSNPRSSNRDREAERAA